MKFCQRKSFPLSHKMTLSVEPFRCTARLHSSILMVGWQSHDDINRLRSKRLPGRLWVWEGLVRPRLASESYFATSLQIWGKHKNAKIFPFYQNHLYCTAARVKTHMSSGFPMMMRNLKFRSEIEFKGARAGQGPGAPGPNDRYSGSGVRSCFSTLHCTIAQAASPNHQTSPIL